MNLKSRFSPNKENFRMHHTDSNLYPTMSEKIISWLPAIPKDYVLICIGTDRSTGDSLGPLVGTLFSETRPKHMTVYGTLHEPVHATNLQEYMEQINKQHRDPFIIAIDACLGKNSSVGQIISGTGPIKPGAALNKPLPDVGDVHITGVVNISGFMEHSVLQNTRLSVVMDMAVKISGVLDQIDQRMTYNHPKPSVVLRFKEEMKTSAPQS
ncbi:spore protease YyaC [Oceanobacillus manasiensis]|uniref:spore protease YyaC n=1 Tax=Oceanobacillus manasiensis TaxID=586413 RepID=UPI0005AA9267|nr:spore protease YyaC [Oceanobacillus manasiensis]